MNTHESAQAFSPRGRFFADQTFHFETLRNAGYALSECADLGEVLEMTNPEDTLQAFSHYRLAPIVDRIHQDVLILAGTEDHFIPFHQVADFEKSLVNARSVTTRVFDQASGGGEHCQCGSTSLVHAAVFDWLLQRFPAVSKA